MILVDIYVPSMNETCNFQVDETAPIRTLIDELAEMLENETKSAKKSSAGEFLLCSMDQNRILAGSLNLQAYGVKNGSRLMLV